MKKMKHYVGIRKSDKKAQVMFTKNPNGIWGKKSFTSVTGPFESSKKAQTYVDSLNNV